MLAFWLILSSPAQLLIKLRLNGGRRVGASQFLQTPDPHLHEIARLARESGALVEPVERLDEAIGVVSGPGAALKQLRANVVALLGVEIGVGRGPPGAVPVAGRQQRQRVAVSGVMPAPPGRRLQSGFERACGLRRTVLV